MNLIAHPFFDPQTGSWSYLLANPGSGCCAIVDPVLGYDEATGAVDTAPADAMVQLVQANGYCVEWILETHLHANRLSASRYLKAQFLCAQVAMGRSAAASAASGSAAANDSAANDRAANEFAVAIRAAGMRDCVAVDRWLEDGDRIALGHTWGRVLTTPGHTSGCLSFLFDSFVLVGATLLAPDLGTGRCDLPGGDCATLYDSVQRLYGLPDEGRVLLGYDAAPAGRSPRFASTMAEQRAANCLLSAGTRASEFVARRSARDRSLGKPRLLEPALQANRVGGVLPGWRYRPAPSQSATVPRTTS
jgi:glyoxylase-like metal-dependent hydrolase (beta-lactamase superfamily II)